MKCPKCGNEMLAGKVECGREIMWVADGAKPKRVSSKLFGVSKAYAERCEKCGIIVIEEED